MKAFKLTIKQRCIQFLIRWIGHWRLKTAHCVGRFVGWILWHYPNSKPRKVALRNIQKCFPDKTAAWQHALARNAMQELGKGVLEAPSFWFKEPNKLRALLRNIHGEEAFKKAYQLGRGIIALGAHMGAFEFLNVAFSDRYPCTWIYRPQRDAFEEMILKARQRTGSTFVPAGILGVQKLYQTIKAGGIVGMACDHDPGEIGGVYSTLFGIKAWTMNLAPRLARVKQSPVFFIYVERLPRSQGYDIHLLPVSNDIYHEDEIIAARAMNQAIEQAVAQCPAQYEWHYKRFRRGLKGFYDGT